MPAGIWARALDFFASDLTVRTRGDTEDDTYVACLLAGAGAIAVLGNALGLPFDCGGSYSPELRTMEVN